MVYFCKTCRFIVCEWNPSADTDTWILFQQTGRILHPVKRRWPGMQCRWDSCQVWSIIYFTQPFARLISQWYCWFTSPSLESIGLHWFGLIFALCIQAVITSAYLSHHFYCHVQRQWTGVDITWLIIGARNCSHSIELVWPWEYYMVKNNRNALFSTSLLISATEMV